MVLVVEDDTEMRAILVTYLADEGYDVVQASTGAEAIVRLFHRLGRHPDVIVADVHLPGWSGLDVLAGVRARQWPIPVILITAFGGDAIHQDGKRLGALAVLDKPFRLADLRALVRDAVAA